MRFACPGCRGRGFDRNAQPCATCRAVGTISEAKAFELGGAYSAYACE
jgi:DnaJ-class molecular chaperone